MQRFAQLSFLLVREKWFFDNCVFQSRAAVTVLWQSLPFLLQQLRKKSLQRGINWSKMKMQFSIWSNFLRQGICLASIAMKYDTTKETTGFLLFASIFLKLSQFNDFEKKKKEIHWFWLGKKYFFPTSNSLTSKFAGILRGVRLRPLLKSRKIYVLDKLKTHGVFRLMQNTSEMKMFDRSVSCVKMTY